MELKLDNINGRFDLVIEMVPALTGDETVRVKAETLTPEMVAQVLTRFSFLNLKEYQIAAALKQAKASGRAEVIVGNCQLCNIVITPTKEQRTTGYSASQIIVDDDAVEKVLNNAEILEKLKNASLTGWSSIKLPPITFPEFKEAGKVKNKEFYEGVKVNKKISFGGLLEELPATEKNIKMMLEQTAEYRSLLQTRNATISRIEDYEREIAMLKNGVVWELGMGASIGELEQWIVRERKFLKFLNEQAGLKIDDAEKTMTWKDYAKRRM